MNGSARNISLTSLDDLFSTQEGRENATLERIVEIPLEQLYTFKNHPFRVVDDEEMQKTADSIREYGVLMPGIVRPRAEGGYEIISGHRRKRGCEIAGRTTMPVIVRELDDDEATIIMVDSNLQRENILPSERAAAYQMKMEAIRRSAGRPSKENCDQLGHNFSGQRSIDITETQTEPIIVNMDKFSVYDDIRAKLIARGVPAEEIAFIHDANTEVKKKELFAKVRAGQVRVLMGSTAKMGAGSLRQGNSGNDQ